MKKRLCSFIAGTALKTAAVVFALSTLVSCGGNKKSESDDSIPSDPAKLTGSIIVLHHRTDSEALFNEYKKRFNEKYPNVNVEFEAITDYAGTVRTRMSTKEYGDVLMMVTTPPVPSDFERYYEPLGTTEELFPLYPLLKYSQNAYFDGKVYGLPINANTGGLVYNKRVFEKAGITSFPKTSEEFYAMLEQIKKNTDAVPIFINYPSKWTLTQWEAGRMAYAGDSEYANKIIHEDAPFQPGTSHYELYKVMYEVVKRGLCEKDLLTSDWERSKQQMADGEIGVMNLGSWAVGQIKDLAKNPEDIGYMPYPVSHDGVVYAEASYDYNLAVNKYSQNKAAAKAWAYWFSQESGYALDIGAIPAYKGGKYPDFLSSFEEMNVQFISGSPAKDGEEGLFDQISNESEIGFWTDPQLVRIVDAAMGTTKESFDDIMADWNARWAKARKTLGVK